MASMSAGVSFFVELHHNSLRCTELPSVNHQSQQRHTGVIADVIDLLSCHVTAALSSLAFNPQPLEYNRDSV